MTPRPRGPLLRALLTFGGIGVLAVALLAAGVAFGGGRPSDEPATPAARPATGIAALQEELRRVPGNAGAWAQLGAAYVQQARLTADPTLYGKADGAFAQSLQVKADGNDGALAGQASLAAARHDFTRAVELSDAALAVNAYSPAALAVKVDGLTELGRYADARTVLDRLLQLHPGVDSFTRASYALELSGDGAGARAALDRALGVASAPADKAFVHYYLGELAWNSGDVDAAAGSYDAAVADDEKYLPALTGRAKVRAQRGDIDGAVADYRTAIAAQPQPASLVELGELLQAQGRAAEADQQYAVVRATQQLYAASGQVVDAELAVFEADHGDAPRAVELAGRAHATRPDSIVAEDAYAWALHAAGRDGEALPLARAAVRTGLRSPSMAYHLGAIEAALGRQAEARADLSRALALNPAWSPLHAERARALLAGQR